MRAAATRRGVHRVAAALVLFTVAALVWLATAVQAHRVAALAAPPPPADRQTHPLRRPPGVPVTAAPYAFSQLQPGSHQPVAYDPCRPVHYVVRPDGSPPGGEQLIRDAVAQVSAATGLVFVSDGTTTEAPSDRRRAYQPGRYGRRWAPVLLAWSDATETPGLAGPILGRGGSMRYDGSGRDSRRYVSGQVVLDAPELTSILDMQDGPAIVRAVVLHELGHVVGLAHVPDEFQLMNADTTPYARTLQSGDRQGLAQLGAGRCFSDT